jgi:RHS repeat-associated protein
MSNQVYANNMEVSCKQAAGKSICAFPDVCMTPPQTPATPPGVPIPYPNTGMASDTTDGSTTVNISGQEVMLKNKSSFKKSAGDEAGAAPLKGVVTHKNTGKVYFNAWSMDVKVEGENVVRMLDITTHNHASQPGNSPPWPYIDEVAAPDVAPSSTTCTCSVGAPVVIATGEKMLDQTDFSLSGDVNLEWRRRYRSGDARVDGWFGQGWSHPLSTELWLQPDVLRYWDATGREVALPQIEVGQEYFHAYEQFTLIHPAPHHWALRHNHGVTHHFRVRASNQWRLPLEVVQDRNGNRVVLRFDDADFADRFNARSAPPRPTGLTDSAGRELHLGWTDAGQLSRVTVQAGDITVLLSSYQYDDTARSVGDALPDLVSQTNATGQTRTFRWEEHLLVGYTRATGQRYANRYDRKSPSGRVIESWALDDGTGLSFAYNGRTTRVRDALGRITTYVRDARGDIIAVHDAEGGVTRSPFDAEGRPEGVTDALGRSTITAFDERGNLCKIIDANGNTTLIDYNDLDLPIQITDAMGGTWQRQYDARGNPIASTDPLGRTTRFEVDTKGRVRAIEDAMGKRKILLHDEAGNLIAYTDCSGHTTRYTYDALGHMRSCTDALEQTTHFVFDPLGNLVQEVEPDGATHHYEWDGEGNLVAYIDPLRRLTRWRYNGIGDLLEQVDALGQKTTYQYDAAGRLSSFTNEKGEVTRFGYDRLDRLTDEIGFDGRHTRYCHNAAGGLTHIIERGGTAFGPGKVTRFECDAVGNVLAKHPVGAEHDRSAGGSFTYDKLDRLTSARNGLSAVTFVYDPVGQLIQEDQHIRLPGEQAQAFSFKHHYDSLGNRTETVLPNGKVIHQLFYGPGHLHQINLDGQEISNFERDNLYREVRRSQGSLVSEFVYDASDRLKAQRVTRKATPALIGLIERHYDYDPAGQLRKWKDKDRDINDYRYDAVSRVTDSVIGQMRIARAGSNGNAQAVVEHFQWDPASNPLSTGTDAHSTGLTVVGDRLLAWQDVRYAYDVYGNLTERLQGMRSDSVQTRTRLYWDADHQLVRAEVERGSDTFVAARSYFSYAYDAIGRRVAKSDALGVTYFAWDDERLTLQIRGCDETIFLYKPESFLPLAQFFNGTLHHLHTDHLGTPLEASNDEGRITWKVTYRTHGNVLAAEISEIQQPLRFQGQYYDEETGLYYNRYRYYEPETSRFISQDPLGLAANSNLYRYAVNTTGWIDPLGLAGSGGAYIFELKSGKRYIGKGEEDRFKASKKGRGGGKNDCNIAAAAHVDTGGDNELGKMVEYKTMVLSKFKAGIGRAGVPAGFLNSHISGATAWAENPDKRAAATKKAKDLLEKLEADRAARACKK